MMDITLKHPAMRAMLPKVPLQVTVKPVEREVDALHKQAQLS